MRPHARNAHLDPSSHKFTQCKLSPRVYLKIVKRNFGCADTVCHDDHEVRFAGLKTAAVNTVFRKTTTGHYREFQRTVRGMPSSTVVSKTNTTFVVNGQPAYSDSDGNYLFYWCSRATDWRIANTTDMAIIEAGECKALVRNNGAQRNLGPWQQLSAGKWLAAPAATAICGTGVLLTPLTSRALPWLHS